MNIYIYIYHISHIVYTCACHNDNVFMGTTITITMVPFHSDIWKSQTPTLPCCAQGCKLSRSTNNMRCGEELTFVDKSGGFLGEAHHPRP